MHFCSHFLNRFKKKAVENKQKKEKEKKKTGKETSFLFLRFPSWRLNKNSFIWLGQIIYLCYYKVLNQGFVRSHNWSFRSVSPLRNALRRFKTLIQIKVLINTVFRRLYWYSSIALKVILSLSDRYKIFTSDWIWIEVCQNAVISKIDITMTTMNKKRWKR